VIINEQGRPRVILDIERVPVYLGFFLVEDKDHYGLGPYVIVNCGSKDVCHVLNCKTHAIRDIPWGTKVVVIKINLTWMYVEDGDSI
jgi:hypothetical protein